MKTFILSFGLLLCTILLADPPPAPKTFWRNTNYYNHYILFDSATNTYVETVNCKAAWRFTKIGGDLNNIILRDAGRKLNVKLSYGSMWLKFDTDADYKFYQYGTFEQKARFFHQVNGTWTGTLSRGNGCQWEELLAGHSTPSFHFVAYGENAASVFLYDKSRNMRVRLDAAEMWLQQSGAAVFSFFKKGYWSAY
jgi:hypothetical protein